MFKTIIRSIKRFVTNIKNRIKQWSRPTTIKLAAEALSDLKRSRKDLIAENALLRQQLIVLNRQVKRPQLTQGRSYQPGHSGQADRFLAASTPYRATRYSPALASRPVPPLLALEI